MIKQKVKTKSKSYLRKISLISLCFILLFLAVSPRNGNPAVSAQSVQEQINALRNQNTEYQNTIEKLRNEATSYQDAIVK